jgi:hypothetical protein
MSTITAPNIETTGKAGNLVEMNWDPAGSLCVTPISWDKETKFRLPLKVWKEMMDAYYPNSAWLCLRRDVFEDLHRFTVERGIPTWEQAFEIMLASQRETTVPR